MMDSQKDTSMNNIMVDIETLGSKSNSAILSIAAIKFDLATGHVGDTFYQAITIKSNMDVKLEVSSKTALWWMNQEEALEHWCKSTKEPLKVALELFSDFLTHDNKEKDFYIWGNSNRFDLGLLDNAYSRVELDIPWKFRNERDVRTLVSFDPKVKEKHIKMAKEEGRLLHDPLEDCLVQIEYCAEIFSNIIYHSGEIELDLESGD